MDGICELQTDRLYVHPLGDEDIEPLEAMHSDPSIMRTLGGVHSPMATQEYIETNKSHWESDGHGLWAFYDKEDDTFVGRGGLRKVMVNGETAVELTYALHSDYWGKGLATEMALASVEVAFDELHLPEVVAFTLPGNAASQGVIIKAGFRKIGTIQHCGEEHFLWRLTRDNWDRFDPAGY